MFRRILTVYLLEQWQSSIQGTVISLEPLNIKKLLRAVRDFFIKCVKYLQASIPELKKSLTFFRLPERHQAMLDEWDVLMQGFLRFITEMNPFESEFLEYQATPDDKFSVYFDKDDKPIGTDHIWHQISKQVNLYSGQRRFKYFAEFAKFLLLISHSNSFCESIFSAIGKICTDGAHNLGKYATQVHASTSVYAETTFIRSIFLGIMILRNV